MPDRVGYYGGRGRAALSGAFSGVEDFADTLMKRHESDRVARRNLDIEEQRKRFDEADKHVIAGDWEPAQAATYANGGNTNGPFRPEHFASGAPTSGSLLEKLQAEVTKPGPIEATPGPEAIAAKMGAKRLPVMGTQTVDSPAQPDAETGMDTLASRQTSPANSPEFQKLLKLRDEKMAGYPLQRIEGAVDDSGQPTARFEPPASMLGAKARAFATSATPEQVAALEKRGMNAVDANGIPTQKGRQTGETNIAEQLANELNPTRTQAEVTAEKTKLRGTRIEQGLTTEHNAFMAGQGAVRSGSTPAAMALKMADERQTAKVKEDLADEMLQESGVSPNSGQLNAVDQLLGKTPWNFSYVDTAKVPAEMKGAFYRAINKNPGIKVVNEKQATDVAGVVQVVDNYRLILDAFSKWAPKTPKARIFGAPANTFAVFAQTHPDLAAASKLAAIESMGAGLTMIGQAKGVRSNKEMLDKFKSIGPEGSDDLPTLQAKLRLFEDLAENRAKSIVGIRE